MEANERLLRGRDCSPALEPEGSPHSTSQPMNIHPEGFDPLPPRAKSSGAGSVSPGEIIVKVETEGLVLRFRLRRADLEFRMLFLLISERLGWDSETDWRLGFLDDEKDLCLLMDDEGLTDALRIMDEANTLCLRLRVIPGGSIDVRTPLFAPTHIAALKSLKLDDRDQSKADDWDVFQRMISDGRRREAATFAVSSPNLVRKSEVVATLRGLKDASVLLHYFQSLMYTQGVSLDESETLEYSRLVWELNDPSLREKWKEDLVNRRKITCSEELGRYIHAFDRSLAFSVFIQAEVPERCPRGLLIRGARVETDPSTKKSFVAYVILVKKENEESARLILRRYSQFAALKRRLKSELNTVVKLPKKKLFNMDKKVIFSRRIELQKFLDTLVSEDDLFTSDLVQDFLSRDTGIVKWSVVD